MPDFEFFELLGACVFDFAPHVGEHAVIGARIRLDDHRQIFLGEQLAEQAVSCEPVSAREHPIRRWGRNGLARIKPEELPRREAGEDVADQRKPRLVEEALAFLFADRDSAVVVGPAVAGHADIRILERAVVPRARPVVRGDEEPTVVVDGRQHALVGLPIRVGRGEDDRLQPDVPGLEGGDRGHAAGVCSGEHAKAQDGNGSVVHGSSCSSETGYRSIPRRSHINRGVESVHKGGPHAARSWRIYFKPGDR